MFQMALFNTIANMSSVHNIAFCDMLRAEQKSVCFCNGFCTSTFLPVIKQQSALVHLMLSVCQRHVSDGLPLNYQAKIFVVQS